MKKITILIPSFEYIESFDQELFAKIQGRCVLFPEKEYNHTINLITNLSSLVKNHKNQNMDLTIVTNSHTAINYFCNCAFLGKLIRMSTNCNKLKKGRNFDVPNLGRYTHVIFPDSIDFFLLNQKGERTCLKINEHGVIEPIIAVDFGKNYLELEKVSMQKYYQKLIDSLEF